MPEGPEAPLQKKYPVEPEAVRVEDASAVVEVAYDSAAEKAEGAQLNERLTAAEAPSSRIFERYRADMGSHPEFRSMFEPRLVEVGYHNILECAKRGVNDMTYSSPGTLEDSTKIISAEPYHASKRILENRAKVAKITRDAVATVEDAVRAEVFPRQLDQMIASFLRRRFDDFMETLDERDLSINDADTVRTIHRAVTGILDTGVNPNSGERAHEFVLKYPAAMVMERISTVESISPALQRAILPDATGRRMVEK